MCILTAVQVRKPTSLGPVYLVLHVTAIPPGDGSQKHSVQNPLVYYRSGGGSAGLWQVRPPLLSHSDSWLLMRLLMWLYRFFTQSTFYFILFFISLIADGTHHYHPACGHKGSSHLSPVHALQLFIAMQVQHSYNSSANG